jgi:hypothetical protein
VLLGTPLLGMVALHVVLGMLAINLTNLVGNSLYSIMDAFFPHHTSNSESGH